MQRIKEVGFKIQFEKEVILIKDLVFQFYYEYEGKDFFEGLIDYMIRCVYVIEYLYFFFFDCQYKEVRFSVDYFLNVEGFSIIIYSIFLEFENRGLYFFVELLNFGGFLR